MNDMTVEKPASQVALFRQQLDSMADQFKAALPAHIPVERFARVITTAVQNNPELLAKADRRSLWNAAMRAAQDGLLPDGREGAIVLFKSQAQWMPMIGGLRKKVRNSGEIATWDVYVVHANDEFDFELGDEPFIRHKPTLDDPGQVIAAYSIATLKSGEKSREVMSVAAIEKVRAVSKAKDNGPWVTWYEEMCRKTVARRHSKSLPMSTDMDDLIRRDDELYDFDTAREEAQTTRPRSLASKLDMLAAPMGEARGDETPAAGEEEDSGDNGKHIETPAPMAKPTKAAPAKDQDPEADAPMRTVPASEAAGEAARTAAEASSARLSEADKKLLRRYAEGLSNTITEKLLNRASGNFLSDHPIDEGTPVYVAAQAILAAHRKRVAGDQSVSISDIDNEVRRLLA
jgi:recombination protein RecT